MLEFRTLGTIDLRGAAGERIDSIPAHSKRLSLLAFLCAAHPPRPHRRDTLVALLWPELDEAHARGSLRHELYELRRALGPGVISGAGETVGIDPQRLWCDAAALEAAASAGRLEDAVELWGGEFLPGWHVNEGEFEHWLDETRERLARRVLDAGKRLSLQAAEVGDLAGAVGWARRLTLLAPYDETGWQRLISLLDRQGDRAGALIAYDALTARLRSELEVEPSPETRALADRIRERVVVFETPAPVRPAGVIAASDPDGVGRSAPDAASPVTAVSAGARRQREGSRPGSRRKLSLVVSALLVMLGAFAARATNVQLPFRTPFARAGSVVIELPTVEDLTGDSDLEPVRRRVADRLAASLLEMDFVVVIAPGERGRATALVSASLYRRGESLELRTQLREAGAGARILEMLPAVTLAAHDPDAGLDTVVAHVLSAIATHYDPRFEGAATPHTVVRPPLWAAYLEYVKGSDLFGHQEYGAAADHLLRAYQLDRRFDKTAVFGAAALALSGRPAAADSVASELLASDSALSDYSRWFARWLIADLRGRRAEAYRAAMEYARAGAGTSPSAIAVAAREAIRMNRPREAVRYLQRVDVDHGWLRNYTALWEFWAGSFHMTGSQDRELEIALAGGARFPESLALVRTEVRARAARLEVARVEELVMQGFTLPPGEDSPAAVAWVAAQELDAHGRADAAAAARQAAIAWLTSHDQPTPHEMLLHARLLLETGAAGDAVALMTALPPLQGLDRLEALGLSGLVAAAAGDSAGARDVIARLEQLGQQNPYLSGRHLLLATGVRAALNEGDAAMETLRRAIAAGLPFGVELHALPMLRPIAGRSDFAGLLRPRG